MPARDGTGPLGQGPLTGHGAGFGASRGCGAGRGRGCGFGAGNGNGFGRGRGAGLGWGLGRGTGSAAPSEAGPPRLHLARQAEALQARLDAIRERLSHLEQGE